MTVNKSRRIVSAHPKEVLKAHKAEMERLAREAGDKTVQSQMIRDRYMYYATETDFIIKLYEHAEAWKWYIDRGRA